MSVRTRAAASAGVLAVMTACLSGCVTKTHDDAPPPVVSQVNAPSTTPAAASSTPPVASGSAAPSAAVLPSGCSQLLPLGTLESILGFGILGEVSYLKAAPVPQSGRTGRVTCSYGTTTSVATPTPPTSRPSRSASPKATASPQAAAPSSLLQISYITYVDAKTAAARVQTTVETDGASAVVTDVTVSGKPANVLIGPTSSELLMSDGARTIVVVASSTVLTPDKAPAGLESIAAAMLHFGQPTPSPSAAGSS
jgi:hypothetical protein